MHTAASFIYARAWQAAPEPKNQHTCGSRAETGHSTQGTTSRKEAGQQDRGNESQRNGCRLNLWALRSRNG